MSEICKCCGGGDNGEEHLDWCDTPLYDRIADLEQQLSALRAAVDRYMDEAWHHEDCPSYHGDTFEHCTCGYTALKEQDK